VVAAALGSGPPREPLAVAGEARYRLAPLTLPDLDDLAEAARAEAVELFADRARRADAQFALDAQTGPAVARLVTRLDGMPLAIERAGYALFVIVDPAIPLPGLVARHEDGMAAAGIKATPGTPDPGDSGKLNEGAVAVPPR
jgi:hypothetical protein